MEEAPEDEEEVYLVPHDDGEVVFGTGEVSSTHVGLHLIASTKNTLFGLKDLSADDSG